MLSAKAVLKAALRKIADRQPVFTDDPYWGSGHYSGSKWARLGYHAAIQILESTPPRARESAKRYAARLLTLLEQQRQEFYNDPDDEDGWATGAVVTVMSTIQSLIDPL